MGANGIFTAGDEVVLRICRTTAPPEQAIWLAGELLRRGVRVPPAVRDTPFRSGDLAVFAVARIEPVGQVDWHEVGEMIARVHTIEPAVVIGHHPLPWCGSFQWWDFPKLLVEVGELIDGPARRALAAAIERCWPLVEASRAELTVVCHGDVHPGNVLPTAAGMVLLDWDLLCFGPPAWDHAALMTWSDRWGGVPKVYEAFAEGYGRSLRGVPAAEAFAELRLVAATLMRVRAGLTDLAAAAEAGRRLRWWRGDPDAPAWQAQ
ncbi:MAG: phosphotransferase [Ilumatobacteraceae bacterium]